LNKKITDKEKKIKKFIKSSNTKNYKIEHKKFIRLKNENLNELIKNENVKNKIINGEQKNIQN